MNQPMTVTKEQVEILKAKLGIDELIAERWDKSRRVVEEDYDPRLIKIILEYLHERTLTDPQYR